MASWQWYCGICSSIEIFMEQLCGLIYVHARKYHFTWYLVLENDLALTTVHYRLLYIGKVCVTDIIKLC